MLRATQHGLQLILHLRHTSLVPWQVEFHDAFDPEFDAQPKPVEDELRAHAPLLEQFGPH